VVDEVPRCPIILLVDWKFDDKKFWLQPELEKLCFKETPLGLPNYNLKNHEIKWRKIIHSSFLKEAIDSALNQTYCPSEVIVVDDGSTDNSREIIARYVNKIILMLKKKGGQASAFNVGFAASRGDIICFLDSDDAFLPEKVAEVVDALGERQDLGLCYHPVRGNIA
jgi:glycosyltransferase involved in cell wall biosynthesis